MCARYATQAGDARISFLSDTDVPVANAEYLTNKIMTELDRINLDLQNMTGFASDGAAVFVGKKSDVRKRLKDRNTCIITTHWKDHSLALACRDSYTKDPGMKNYMRSRNICMGTTSTVPKSHSKRSHFASNRPKNTAGSVTKRLSHQLFVVSRV